MTIIEMRANDQLHAYLVRLNRQIREVEAIRLYGDLKKLPEEMLKQEMLEEIVKVLARINGMNISKKPTTGRYNGISIDYISVDVEEYKVNAE